MYINVEMLHLSKINEFVFDTFEINFQFFYISWNIFM